MGRWGVLWRYVEHFGTKRAVRHGLTVYEGTMVWSVDFNSGTGRQVFHQHLYTDNGLTGHSVETPPHLQPTEDVVQPMEEQFAETGRMVTAVQLQDIAVTIPHIAGMGAKVATASLGDRPQTVHAEQRMQTPYVATLRLEVVAPHPDTVATLQTIAGADASLDFVTVCLPLDPDSSTSALTSSESLTRQWLAIPLVLWSFLLGACQVPRRFSRPPSL